MFRYWPLCALLLLTATGHAAPIYKWTDKQGATHYEDQRPREGEVEVIRPPEPWRGPPQDAAGNAQSDPNQEHRARQCSDFREQLAAAEAADRLYELDAQGARRYLDEEERKLHLQKLQLSIDYWCK
ncbi:MAG TPA: DUF4124 domain-containing protein [Gammaproteobacteria bacterium]